MKFRVLVIFIIIYSFLQAKSDFHFAVLSDRAGGVNQKEFKKVVNEIMQLQPDFIITVGDLSDDAQEEQYQKAMEVMKSVNIPVYYTPGNNDIVDNDSELLFKKYTGKDPYYSFNVQNSHFIILDNSRIEAYTEMDSTQQNWFKNDLETNKNSEDIFVVMHKPFWADGIAINKKDEMHELFVKYHVKAVFAGHWHQYAHDQFDDVNYYMAGSSGAGFVNPNDNLGKFYQFLWCRLKDNQLTTSIIKTGAIFKDDLMTMEEEQLDYQIENKALDIKGAYSQGSANMTIMVKNITEKPINEMLYLESDGNWKFPSNKIVISLKPHSVYEKSFNIAYQNEPYPLPKFRFNYPFGRNKMVKFNQKINLVAEYNLSVVSKNPFNNATLSKKELKKWVRIHHLYDSEGNPSSLENTDLFMAKDHENLYLVIQASESKPDSLKLSAHKDNNDIFSDDSFGFLIAQSKALVYQIYINPKSVQWDMKCDLINGDYDLNWDCNLDSKITIGKKSITAQIKIPLSSLNFDPAQPIYLNFCRTQTSKDDAGMIAPHWNLDTSKYLILH